MDILPFADWKPDLAPYKAASSQLIENVFPRADGYGPVASVSPYSQALPAPCRGYFYARNADQSVTVFAATASKLYKLNNTDFSWSDVSKGGGSYTGVGNGEQWQFAQFNNFVIAVQINTVPQVFDLTSSSAFADLGGSPPPARYVAVVNRFVVLSGLGTATPYRIQWSGLNAVTTWTSGVNSSDFQDLPDGGVVRAIGGGETGLITQDGSLRRMIFAPGAPYVFQIERVAQDKGIFAPLSLVRAGDRLFFCGNDGFYMILPGGYPVPIGKERFDRTFFGDVDAGQLHLVIGASDPRHARLLDLQIARRLGLLVRQDPRLRLRHRARRADRAKRGISRHARAPWPHARGPRRDLGLDRCAHLLARRRRDLGARAALDRR